MKRCLVDVNVLIALLVRQHQHHAIARRWYDGLQAGQAGLCRLVQLAVVRLLGNQALMRDRTLSARAGWNLVAELLEDERCDFLAEPPGVDAIIPNLLQYNQPTTKLTTDAYLAAFAIAGSYRLASFDQSFREFRELEIEWLH